MSEPKKRIVMDIDVNFHAEIKMRAARLNIPMKTWIKRAMAAAIKREDQYMERPIIKTEVSPEGF